MSDLREANAKQFSATLLPLYHHPTVKIRISSGDSEYEVSKSLLCKESTYFAAMFEGKFAEANQQVATLEEVEGIVSVRSLEALIQWVYMGNIQFDCEDPEEKISAAIELVRLADMCGITGMESQMAQFIKAIFVAHRRGGLSMGQRKDANTYCLTRQHIIWATFLPPGHSVRRIIAAASVEGYIRSMDYKFAQETQEYPTFGADLLQEVSSTLRGLEKLTKEEEAKTAHEPDYTEGKGKFYDPISGEEIIIYSSKFSRSLRVLPRSHDRWCSS